MEEDLTTMDIKQTGTIDFMLATNLAKIINSDYKNMETLGNTLFSNRYILSTTNAQTAKKYKNTKIIPFKFLLHAYMQHDEHPSELVYLLRNYLKNSMTLNEHLKRSLYLDKNMSE